MRKAFFAILAASALCSALVVQQVSAAPVYLRAPYTGSCDCGASSQTMNTYPGWWSTDRSTGGIGIGASIERWTWGYWISSWAEASLYKKWVVPSGWHQVRVTASFTFTGGSEHLWTWPGKAWLFSTLRVGRKGSLAKDILSDEQVAVSSKVFLPDRWDINNATEYGTQTTYTILNVKPGTIESIAAGTNTACGVVGFSNANATYGVRLNHIMIERIY